MPIQIQAHGFSLTRSLERYVLRRVDRGLGSRLSDASKLRIGLSDINGPRGGADKCCQVHIALPRQRDVLVKDTQPDMYNAIDSALRRARQALSRRKAKMHGRKASRTRTDVVETSDADKATHWYNES